MMTAYDRTWSKQKRRRGGGRRSSKDDLCLDGLCKNHEGHRQSPGVCSLCLNEKLSQLQRSVSSRPHSAASIGSRASSISSSLLSFYSCSSATLTSSPSHNLRWDPVPESKGKGPWVQPRLVIWFSGRSRMVAASSPRAEDRKDDGDHGLSMKKRGNWWKLIRPRSKRLFLSNSVVND